jgi:hypothetical protein
MYGCSAACALCVPPWPVEDSFPDPEKMFTGTIPWLIGELNDWMSRLPRKILLPSLREHIESIHPKLSRDHTCKLWKFPYVTSNVACLRAGQCCLVGQTSVHFIAI